MTVNQNRLLMNNVNLLENSFTKRLGCGHELIFTLLDIIPA